MPKQQTDHLIQLISSLTKGEKRSFRLFVNRDTSNSEKLFMLLFDHIDKYGEYNEEAILKRIPRIKKSQLSNLKRNLYDQILLSLRNMYRHSSESMSIRELIDYAKILYDRGMYKPSLAMLEKAKKLSLSADENLAALSVVNLERHIESQHITGSMFGKAEEIIDYSNRLLQKVNIYNELSNFSLMLYGFYLQYGYVKDIKDYRFVSEYFQSHLPKVELDQLDFQETVLYHQSYVWYYNMIQDFPNYYRHAQSWVDTFHKQPNHLSTYTSLYLKGIHNLLNSLFMVQRYDRFKPVYDKLITYKENQQLLSNLNNRSLWTLFYYIHGINEIYLTADYKNGVAYVDELEVIISENKFNWDLHRILVFYYKMACVYFGADRLDKCIFYLNKITNNYYPDFRNDIQCFARILNLIAHFELGNNILVSYQVKSVYRFLLKTEDLQEVQKEILKFLRKTPKMSEKDIVHEFQKLKDKLVVLKNDNYERRPFLYLDIISWLESKIYGLSMQEAIKRNIAD
jgi:hypothetical protein